MELVAASRLAGLLQGGRTTITRMCFSTPNCSFFPAAEELLPNTLPQPNTCAHYSSPTSLWNTLLQSIYCTFNTFYNKTLPRHLSATPLYNTHTFITSPQHPSPTPLNNTLLQYFFTTFLSRNSFLQTSLRHSCPTRPSYSTPLLVCCLATTWNRSFFRCITCGLLGVHVGSQSVCVKGAWLCHPGWISAHYSSSHCR